MKLNMAEEENCDHVTLVHDLTNAMKDHFGDELKKLDELSPLLVIDVMLTLSVCIIHRAAADILESKKSKLNFIRGIVEAVREGLDDKFEIKKASKESKFIKKIMTKESTKH